MRAGIAKAFVAAGFEATVHTIVKQVVTRDWPTFVLKSGLRANSFLAQISDQEFEAGMAALRNHAASAASSEAVVEDLDWFVFTKPHQ